jgi:RNA polymerase sigma factor (sigma-70 family)
VSRSDAAAGWRPDLVRYLARCTGDPDLAEDLAQETFIRLEERPPATETSLRGWLFTVATNLVRDHGRSMRRRRGLLLGRDTRTLMGAPPLDPQVALERAETGRRVRAALEGLSAKERSALLLREAGCTHREIAEAVGTTEKSVGTLLARALVKAARQLGPEET